MCAHRRRKFHTIHYEQIFNNLLRTTMMIVFGLANLNNGLTSYVTKDNINNELHRNINQNLIMSPSAAISGHHYFLPSTSALTASSSSSLSDFPLPPLPAAPQQQRQQHQAPPYSPSSISASSSMFQQTSGSSITSFDSTNVIDERNEQQQQHQQQQQQQQYQQHQQYNSRQIAKDTIATVTRPVHKIVGVNSGSNSSPSGSGVSIGGSTMENHLDTITSGEGGAAGGATDDVYAAPMYFGTENSTVVTTQIGATAHIPCTVHHIGDGVVSWIRKKDYHLLTVGLTTYSSDERFSATHLKHSEDWTLQIKFVQLRDAGVYECQVSTHPPTSIFLHLNVVEARAEISGPPIRYLTPGSTLRLQCRVVQNTEASEFIFWYHDNRMINYDIDRGINVSTEPDFQSSELTILRTRREHSGNFTCVASNTQPASVLVHIFKGDNPAAMYHGHVGSSTKSYQTHLHCIMVIIVMAYRILHTHWHIQNTIV